MNHCTAVDWNSYMRDVWGHALMPSPSVKIGSIGYIVESRRNLVFASEKQCWPCPSALVGVRRDLPGNKRECLLVAVPTVLPELYLNLRNYFTD